VTPDGPAKDAAVIRKRRNGLQVQVYAGRNPLTGRKHGSAVRSLTPVQHTLPTDRGVPRDTWTWPTGAARAIPYHPASQFWPLQLTFLAILLILTAAALVLGRHAIRTRTL
jgi:hypothetical protein